MVLLAPVIAILTTSCMTDGGVTIDSAARLNYVRIIDTSSLTRAEKEALTYNKCVIARAKYNKYSDVCKKLMDSFID